MKKIFLVLVALLVFVSSAFAQKNINEMDGFDWVTWSYEMKVGYLRGFYAAYVSIINFADFKNQENEHYEEAMKEVERQFFIPLGIGELGEKIDNFYKTYNNRKYYLWQVTVLLAGKGWWEE